MSETIQSISNGTYTIGETNNLTFEAGPGITIDSPSAGTVRIGNDETVLWETSSYPGTVWLSANFNEPVSSFERIKFYTIRNALTPGDCSEFLTKYALNNKIMIASDTWVDNNWYRYSIIGTLNNTGFIENSAFLISEGSTAKTPATNGSWLHPMKIIGINRISGGNA